MRAYLSSMATGWDVDQVKVIVAETLHQLIDPLIYEEAATLIEEKVGPAYGGYAHKAADQVSGFAKTLQSKDIDDIISDTREFVRKQPMIAIGAAAAIGFVLTRLVKIGGSSDNDA